MHAIYVNRYGCEYRHTPSVPEYNVFWHLGVVPEYNAFWLLVCNYVNKVFLMAVKQAQNLPCISINNNLGYVFLC
jgi:hypothetical protein